MSSFKLYKIAIFWLAAALIFWLIEAAMLAAPEAAVFGSARILLSPRLSAPLIPGLFIYPALFLILGMPIEFVLRFLSRRFGIGSGFHVRVHILMLLIYIIAGSIITAPRGKGGVLWGVALSALVVVLAIIAWSVSIKSKSGGQVSWRYLIPCVFISLWLLPLLPVISFKSEFFSGPLSYHIFTVCGFAAAASIIRFGIPLLNSPLKSLCATAALIIMAASLFGIIYRENASKDLSGLRAAGSHPNIIMIVLDTVRADHLSCYGYSRATTPNIDKIAARGTLFENAMSASNWTLPSHASMFTGQFPAEHQAIGLNKYLDNTYAAMAQILYRIGYRTAAFSANVMIATTGLDRGFESYWGEKKDKNKYKIKPLWVKWADYFTESKKKSKKIKSDKKKKQKVKRKGHSKPSAGEVADAIIAWLEDSKDRKEPFFLFVNLLDAHMPYLPLPGGEMAQFLPDEAALDKALRVSQNSKAYLAGEIQITAEEFELLRALYDAQIAYMDRQLARLFEKLDELNLSDDSILIVTSDHGDFFGERNLMGHGVGAGYPVLNIPIIATNLPGFDEGSRVKPLVQNIDFLPTFADIDKAYWAGLSKMPGKSLLDPDNDRVGFAESYPSENFLDIIAGFSKSASKKFDRETIAVWSGDYEYMKSSDGQEELYYLPDDPREENNLMASRPERASIMSDLAKKRTMRLQNKKSRKKRLAISSDEKDKLRALGYIQ